MQARAGGPSVNEVPSLVHFFPCLNQTQLIDTKGGLVYIPESVYYDSTLKTFEGSDDLDSARALTSGTPYNFGTDSFGVVVAARINNRVSGRASTLLLGNRVEAGSTNTGIFVTSSVSLPAVAGGFNDNNEYHFTARTLATVTDGNDYIFQITCDRENNILKYKVYDITSSTFLDYTEVSLLPFSDGTFNSGGVNPTQIITSTTDMSAFGVGQNICTRTDASSTYTNNQISNETVATSAANALTVTGQTFDTYAANETYLTDGVTATRRYPDYGNPGSLSDVGNELDVQNASGVAPAAYMKTNNLKMYGAAYFTFANGVPSDWDLGSNWMAWAWKNGYRVPYPNSIGW